MQNTISPIDPSILLLQVQMTYSNFKRAGYTFAEAINYIKTNFKGLNPLVDDYIALRFGN